MAKAKRVKLLIDDDKMPRTWKLLKGNEYCAGMWPTVIGSVTQAEYKRLKKNSIKDSDGWMVEVGG